MKKWDLLKKRSHQVMMMRKLRRYYLGETAYSITFPKWSTKDCNSCLEYSKYPVRVNDLVNIVITLERHFGYHRGEAITLAKQIHKEQRKEIRKHMKKYFKTGTREQRIRVLTRKRALKEQRARGFVDIEDAHLDAELPYIESNIKKIVWPKQWQFKPLLNMAGIYKKFDLIGVSGFTGIRLPKRLLNR